MILSITIQLTPEESKVLSKEKIKNKILMYCKENGFVDADVTVEEINNNNKI